MRIVHDAFWRQPLFHYGTPVHSISSNEDQLACVVGLEKQAIDPGAVEAVILSRYKTPNHRADPK